MTYQRKPLTAAERAEILARIGTDVYRDIQNAKAQARALRIYRDNHGLTSARRKDSLEREQALLQRAKALQTKTGATNTTTPGLTRR